jgi:hypothetical protein
MAKEQPGKPSIEQKLAEYERDKEHRRQIAIPENEAESLCDKVYGESITKNKERNRRLKAAFRNGVQWICASRAWKKMQDALEIQIDGTSKPKRTKTNLATTIKFIRKDIDEFR